ncbi:MAG: L-rhamnose/proton symporter RhaT [Thermoguttaceae bacterium]|nr:L-rhamnose/proton symporter RhaT [Thermoguttaceae bacterium]
MPDVFIGVMYHWIGGFASGSFYLPFLFVRKWSWEVYWLAAGFMSWIFAPWCLAFLLTDSLIPTMMATWSLEPGAMIWAYIFGMMWGIGGLTCGLSMRYLGMSLGMAVSLGYCTVLGSLMPPIFQGTFATQILGTEAGIVNLLGLGICTLGIILAGTAGMSKEHEMSAEAKRESIKEFNFVKGIIAATVAGVFSAGMAYGMTAAEPMAEVTKYFGTDDIWSGLPKLCVILLGGFTTECICCVILALKNKTMYQFFNPTVRERDADGHESEPATVNMVWNYGFCMLAGLTWYMQFFFYSMGETKMGDFQFSSWTLHMASIIVFSSLWGIALKEWSGTSRVTKTLLALGIGTLLYSTLVVGYSNYMNADKSSLKTSIVAADATVDMKKFAAEKTNADAEKPVGFKVIARPLVSSDQITSEERKINAGIESRNAAQNRKAQWRKRLEKEFPRSKSTK